jgi:hypothetical protein
MMIQDHGAFWEDEPGWRVIHWRYDQSTALLAVIMKHDEKQLIKADLFFRFQVDEGPLPRWESVGGVEAIFGAKEVHEAAAHLNTAIQGRTN